MKPLEYLSRTYIELVRRRSRVRFHTPTPVSLNYPPIFVTGVFRSGTTLLRYIIDSHSHIACPPESAFMSFLRPVLDHHLCKDGFVAMGFDDEQVVQQLAQFVNYFMANYAKSRNKRRWADKSPYSVDDLDFLLSMFPDAKFPIIHRHGFDQAHSRTRGGTSVPYKLEDYCREGEDLRIGALRHWCEKVGFIQDFQRRHPDKCFVMYYEKLCRAPEETLKKLFEFLNEPWEPRVLKFYKEDHDVGLEDGRVVATRGFDISEGHYKKWPDSLLDKCTELAEETLSELGYTVDVR